MTISYQTLKTELNTDPSGLGYPALITSGSDNALADALNLSRVTITNISVTLLTPHLVFAAIVPSEWAAVSASNQQIIQMILALDMINPNDTNTKNAFLQAFGSGTTTRTNLNALLTRQGSRAEQLFGAGTIIYSQDVAIALRAT